MCPSYDYECLNCYYKFIASAPYEERDDSQKCPECELSESKRYYGKMPAFTRVTYVDGTKRKGFTELKRASELESEKSGLPPDERGPIQKEIDSLKKL